MVWNKIKSGASTVKAAATAGLAGKLLTFLLVFVFANIGYLTGFPLIIYAWFAGFIEYGNNKKLSICVLIENGGKGSNIPAILTKEIFEYFLKNA